MFAKIKWRQTKKKKTGIKRHYSYRRLFIKYLTDLIMGFWALNRLYSYVTFHHLSFPRSTSLALYPFILLDWFSTSSTSKHVSRTSCSLAPAREITSSNANLIYLPSNCWNHVEMMFQYELSEKTTWKLTCLMEKPINGEYIKLTATAIVMLPIRMNFSIYY